jgi:hypothetical protein
VTPAAGLGRVPSMVPCRRPAGWLWIVLLLLAAACTAGDGSADAPTAAASPAPPTADAALVGEVSAAFATYRAGVAQGDGPAVVAALDQASLADMARVADLAATADEEAVRELPAAEQLLVLTYRLRPELLEADDPYAALVDAGLAGQDRSLGELGAVSAAGDDLALGVVVDAATGAATPLRWRFPREGGRWRFDLVGAHRLLSQAIANGADRAGVGVDEVVTATVVDLSGEPPERVEELYTELPSASGTATTG